MWWLLCVALLVVVNGEAVLAPGSNATGIPSRTSNRETISFYVLADGPYGVKGRQNFAHQLQRLESRPEFLVHLGDTHEREKDCSLKFYDAVADAMLKHVHVPTFVLPGDADWYECSDKTAAWNKWAERFLKFHEHWHHGLEVRHQEERPENFAFAHKGALFVGLHVLDATVDDWSVWNKQVNDDTTWLNEQFTMFAHRDEIGAVVLLCHAYAHSRRYKKFYEEFLNQAKNIDKPILYLHGDSHNFVVDRRFPAKNILRVVLDTTRDSDPMEVTVDPFGAIPFKFNRRPLL